MISNDLLSTLLRFTHPERTRYAMDGVHVNGKDVAATDGKQLMLVVMDEEIPGEPFTAAAAEIRKAQKVRVGRGKRRPPVDLASVVRLNGVFPPYQHVIPENRGHELELAADVSPLLDMLRMLPAVGCRVDVDERGITLTCREPGGYQIVATSPLLTCPVAVSGGFNPELLANALEVAASTGRGRVFWPADEKAMGPLVTETICGGDVQRILTLTMPVSMAA